MTNRIKVVGMILHVEVTEQDIRLGLPRQADRCPIARAINRALPDSDPCVSGSFILLGHDQVDTPADVARWIDRFDAHKASVDPFGFTLELIDQPASIGSA